MAIKGGMDVYNDFANNQVSGKTALSATGAAGGAIGAGALIALGASNPIGWIVLAVGGLALAGRAAWEYAEYCKKSTDATEELQKATEAEIRKKQDKDKKEELILEQYQERIKQSGDLETAKKLAIEAGITTEEEMKEKQIDSMKALQDLTDQYVKSKQQFNDDTTKYLKDLKAENNKDQQAFIQEFLKKYGEDMDYKDLGSKDYKALNAYGLEMQSYAQSLIDAGKISASGDTSNDAYKHIAYMVKNGLMDNNYYDNTFSEWDYRILFRAGTNADRRVVGKQMLLANGGEYYNNVLLDSYVRDVLGNKYNTNYTMGNEQAISNTIAMLQEVINSNEDQEAKKKKVQSYISSLKSYGLYDKDKLPNTEKTILENAMLSAGIESYRSGLSYVPYDDYLANLHEGEAVITAATANELRNLITTYRKSQQTNVNLDTAIQNQTTVLVNKMDQMIQAIENINSPFSTTKSNNTLFDNMKYLRSTKSFNSK